MSDKLNRSDVQAAIAAGVLGVIVGIAIGAITFSPSFDEQSLMAQRYLNEGASSEELCRALANRRQDPTDDFYDFCVAAAASQRPNR